MGRRVALVVVAVAVAAVCVRLGVWQLDRLAGRRAFNDRVRSGIAMTPLRLEDALASSDLDAWAYRRVVVSGTYAPDGELIVYGRSLQGRPGDHVVSVLDRAAGAPILVDRGWIPFDADTRAPVGGDAAAPRADVSITGVLMPSEDASGDDNDASRLGAIDVDEVAERTGASDLLPLYLLLQEQVPAQPAGLPVPAPLPDLGEGPHLSYAIQWFAFAAIAVVGGVVLLRRSGRSDAGANPPSGDEVDSSRG